MKSELQKETSDSLSNIARYRGYLKKHKDAYNIGFNIKLSRVAEVSKDMALTFSNCAKWNSAVSLHYTNYKSSYTLEEMYVQNYLGKNYPLKTIADTKNQDDVTNMLLKKQSERQRREKQIRKRRLYKLIERRRTNG